MISKRALELVKALIQNTLTDSEIMDLMLANGYTKEVVTYCIEIIRGK